MENNTAEAPAAPAPESPEYAEAKIKAELDNDNISVEITLNKKTKIISVKTRGQKGSQILKVLDLGRALIIKKIQEAQPKPFDPHKLPPTEGKIMVPS